MAEQAGTILVDGAKDIQSADTRSDWVTRLSNFESTDYLEELSAVEAVHKAAEILRGEV